MSSAPMSSGPAPLHGSASARTSPRRWIAGGLAVLIAIASTVEAFRQTTRPDPFHPASLGERFLYPMQANAFAQGQVIRSDLRVVFALEDGRHVWAAGTGGLLLRSKDGGQTWEKGEVSTASRAGADSLLLPADQADPGPQQGPPGMVDSASSPPESEFNPPAELGPEPTAAARPDGAPAVARGIAAWAALLGPRPLSAQQKEQTLRPDSFPQRQEQRALPYDSLPQQQVQQSIRTPSQRSIAPIQRGGTTRAPASEPSGPSTPASTSADTSPGDEPAEPSSVAEDQEEPPYTATVREIVFADTLRGWALDQTGGLIVTEDGGASWRRTPEADRPGGIVLRPASSVAEGQAASTARIPVSVPEGGVTASAWGDASHGWVIVDSQSVLQTTDGGGEWRVLRPTSRSDSLVLEMIAAPSGSGGGRAWVACRTGRVWRLCEASSNDTAMVARAVEGTIRISDAAPPIPPLSHLVALDSAFLLAFTRDGRLLRTADGGRTWPDTVPLSRVRDAFFVDGERGWAVGDHGTVYRTTDGGGSWTVLTGRGQRLQGVDFVDHRRGWAVGTGGVVLATRSGGRRWAPQESGTRHDLGAVAALSPTTAVAVGAGGTIVRTTDGGETWAPAELDTAGTGGDLPDFRSVHFADVRTGWAVGSGLATWVSEDGGASWRRRDGGEGLLPPSTGLLGLSADEPTSDFGPSASELSAVFARSPELVHVAGPAGILARSRDRGRRWERDAEMPLTGLFFRDDRGWAVGRDVILRMESDSARTWRRTAIPPGTVLSAVHFVHPDTGWAAGADGALLASTDGGVGWRPEPSGTTTDLLALDSEPGGQVWAVGEGATVLTRRPGAGWQAVAQPGRWWPAPWYFLSWGVVLALAVVAARPAPPEAPAPGVAGIVVNDRPLSDRTLDAFALGDVAAVISRFLRNDRTDPPLTLAVTGPWGSGKTSLMNLVRADLQRNRWRPVLFNAWHHQTEEHLLAALLESVRAQAVPGLLERGGLRFRWRLFWIRFAHLRPAALVALLLAAAYGGALLADPGRIDDLTAAFGSPTAVECQGDAWNCAAQALQGLLPGWEGMSVLLGALVVVGSLWRSVKAFGANPATLLRKAAQGVRLRSLEEQTSFRHRFAREFDEVTRALHPHDVVVFVDDLDRCRPKHVLDVLEGINFLVSSGDCVVVLGMDRERVIRCVGLGFRDEAEEVLGDAPAAEGRGDAEPAGEPQDDEARDRRKRSHFAREYLEKLINVEIPIPTPDHRQFSGLAAPDAAAAGTPPDAVERWTGRVERHAGQIGWAAVALVVLATSQWYFAPRPIPGTPPVASTVRTETPAAVAAPTSDTSTISALVSQAPPAEPARAGAYIARPLAEHPPHVAWMGALLVLLVAGLQLLNRAEPAVRDSETFRVALKAWAPYVARTRSTPRSFKKFLNRVRYYAMRQRAPEPPRPLWARLRDRWAGAAEEAPPPHGGIPEHVLVALAALHECEPDLLADPRTYERFAAMAETRLDRSSLSEKESASLWYAEIVDPDHRTVFEAIAAGIKVS